MRYFAIMFALALGSVYSFNFVPNTEIKNDNKEKVSIGNNVKNMCKFIFNKEFLPYMVYSFYCI